MEIIPIKISQQGQHPHSELSFKSVCTEIKCISHGRWYGQITNIQTYCSQDVSKEQNLIFPTKFIKFFKLLSSSEFGRRFWFDDCSRGNFVEAGIDTNYDADVGDIFSGDSKSDFMRYIYRDMVVPFTKLEKENNYLREQLERKDQELKEKDQELAQMKEELKEKDQELAQMKEELKEKDRELAQMKEELERKDKYFEVMQQELKNSLLTKDEELEKKDRELNNTQEELYTTYQELKELQEDFETKDQELKDTEQELKETKKEVRTRGLLLKSCIDDLKTFTEEIENVEKKKHLNHRLICETSSNFVERNSYFSPEM